MTQQNIPTKLNNPGDLKDPSTGQFQQFATPQQGWSALVQDIQNKQSGATSTNLTGNSSLTDFANTWAPSSDNNNPASYANNLASQLGTTTDTPIGKLSPHDLAMAVAKNEGYQGQPMELYSMQQFGQKIQQKYWQYANLDPATVAQKVLAKYPQYKSVIDPNQTQTDTTQTDQTTQPQDQSLGQELGGRLTGISGNISDIAANLQGKGQQNPLSDILQGVGGIAGGIGDVVNKGLELVPGVKGLENMLGKGVQNLASTPEGQSVVKAMADFSQAHPELSKDIGAGFNIATAIPILKGLGVLKDVAMTGVGHALEGIATKGIANEIEGTAAKTVGGRNIISSLGDDLPKVIDQGIVKTRAIPDIVNGKYDVSEAVAKNEAAISNIAENERQPLLDKASTSGVDTRIPLSDLRKKALANAVDRLQSTDSINNIFDRIQAKYGDYIPLNAASDAKTLIGSQVPSKTFDIGGYNAYDNVRGVLQRAVEDGAKTLNLPDVNAINAKMSLLYKANDLLNSMDGKPVKVGLISKLARKGVSVGAGMLANQFGGGVIGGLGAGYLTDIADKGIQGIGGGLRRKILEGTEPGALSQLLRRGGKVIPKAVGATIAQRQINR